MQTVQRDGVTIHNGALSGSCALHKQGGGAWSPGCTARRRDTQAEKFLVVNKSSGNTQNRITQFAQTPPDLTILALYSPWVGLRGAAVSLVGISDE
jgi:hypothetical protein